MSGFPSWQSISQHALVTPGGAAKQASALLGVDLKGVGPSRHVSEIDGHIGEGSRTPPRVRIKSPSRPRSYVQILEDFHAHEAQLSTSPESSGLAIAPSLSSRAYSQQSGASRGSDLDGSADMNRSLTTLSETDFATSDENVGNMGSPSRSPPVSSSLSDNTFASRLSSAPVTPRRKEDTIRRNKRFSMPAMALQTTPVTAKAASGIGKSKRFSLVLGRGDAGTRRGAHGVLSQQTDSGSKRGLGHGPAATKLNEILGRTKTP
jgi:FYVE/RhoGEF/PH domain-containing protein 5/6